MGWGLGHVLVPRSTRWRRGPTTDKEGRTAGGGPLTRDAPCGGATRLALEEWLALAVRVVSSDALVQLSGEHAAHAAPVPEAAGHEETEQAQDQGLGGARLRRRAGALTRASSQERGLGLVGIEIVENDRVHEHAAAARVGLSRSACGHPARVGPTALVAVGPS